MDFSQVTNFLKTQAMLRTLAKRISGKEVLNIEENYQIGSKQVDVYLITEVSNTPVENATKGINFQDVYTDLIQSFIGIEDEPETIYSASYQIKSSKWLNVTLKMNITN
jgi:hypothetical protein